MKQKIIKKACIFGYLACVAVLFGGCISPKPDAFLLGAGIGAGVTAYFMKGGEIAGYSARSLQSAGESGSAQSLPDSSIPSDLEWYYLEKEIFSDMQLQNQSKSFSIF